MFLDNYQNEIVILPPSDVHPITTLSSLLSGGNATFPNLLNNFVHVCMYFYYMMAAMGPEYAKFLWWKKYMTELQIVSTMIGSGEGLIKMESVPAQIPPHKSNETCSEVWASMC